MPDARFRRCRVSTNGLCGSMVAMEQRRAAKSFGICDEMTKKINESLASWLDLGING
jgi:hypothetical protein